MILQRTAAHSLSGLGALALIAGAVAGCAPTPAPTPTPTAAFASEEEAFAKAEEVYRAYIDAFNAIELDDPATFESVFKFTADGYEASEREDLSAMHAEGYVRGGEIVIMRFLAQSFDGEKVVATTCNDVSTTTFVNKEGVSVVPADRPGRVSLELTFSTEGEDLRLSKAESIEDDKCLAF